MSVIELQSAGNNAHIESCDACTRYLNDMLTLSDGLAALVIPHPIGIQQPVRRVRARSKFLTLAAATLLLLLFATMVAYVISNYFEANAEVPRGRKRVFADPGPTKTAMTPPSAK